MFVRLAKHLRQLEALQSERDQQINHIQLPIRPIAVVWNLCQTVELIDVNVICID